MLVDVALFGFSAVLFAAVSRKVEWDPALAALLFAWHSIFGLVYWRYALSNVADSNGYYEVGRLGTAQIAPGADFVFWVASLLVHDLGVSYLGTFIIFNLVGAIGLLLFAKTLHDIRGTADAGGVFGILPFLPSLSFWSCALGKDAIAFLGITLATFASHRVAARWGWFLCGVGCLFLVRPHMAALMVAAAIVPLLMSPQISRVWRLTALAVAVAGIVAIAPFVLQYVGLGALTDQATSGDYEETVATYIEQRQGSNLDGGSSIDIVDMPMSLQLFTFMFRPLFFDAPGLFGFVVSLENLALLLLCAWSFFRLSRAVFLERSFVVWFNSAFMLGGWFVLALTTSNLGIAVRQKTMVLPSLVVLCLLARFGERAFDAAERSETPKVVGPLSSP